MSFKIHFKAFKKKLMTPLYSHLLLLTLHETKMFSFYFKVDSVFLKTYITKIEIDHVYSY